MADTVQYLRLGAPSDGNLWRGVRRLCCLTGNDGAPIATERWQFFAKVWIAPYEAILPQWSYVALLNDQVIGYLTGCPNTTKFLRQKWLRCDLPQAVHLSAKIARLTPPESHFLKHVTGLLRGPEQSFPAQLRRTIARDYPAHLHMNVEEAYRRQGLGRQLAARYFADLQRARVSGVHLYCGARPREFYRRIGFAELGTIRYGGTDIHACALKL